MESARSDPVCIVNAITPTLTQEHEYCSLEEHRGDWHDLEQFWSDEKHRLCDVDGEEPLSSSLEDHLLHDDVLGEPEEKHNQSQLSLSKNVSGKDVKDIPTSYIVNGFRPQERIVIGTYVDESIILGFRYQVRKNFSDEYLFDRKALHLESIGLGYGKRLTFASPNLNNNINYFWSDSHDQGFGFTLVSIDENDTFRILDKTSGCDKGRAIIKSCLDSEELSTTIEENGRVHKEVRVKFKCDAIFNNCENNQTIVEDIVVFGLAVLIREGFSSKAKIHAISLDIIPLDDCMLVPEE